MSQPDPIAEAFSFPPAAGTSEAESYERFAESMVPFCHCADRYKPCDGVLAGGLCDMMGVEPDPENGDGWVDWEEG